MAKKIRKTILVTGYCRSGTTTMARFLRDCGLGVRHEKMGIDGTVSCFYFIDADYYPLGGDKESHVGDGKLSLYEFDTVVHLVRNPMLAIPSQSKCYSTMHKKWLDQHGFVNAEIKPNMLHAARLWVEVNRRVEKIADLRINIERLQDDWPKLFKKIGYPKDKVRPEIRYMNKASGNRKVPPLKITDLRRMCSVTARNVEIMGKKYGYKI